MKYITTLFFLFIFLLILFQNTQIQTVFSEQSNLENSFTYCYVTFKDRSITTKNVINKLENMEIIFIMPYINPIYESRVQELEAYYFTADTLENNINTFTKQYNTVLEKHGFLNDVSKNYIHGISLKQAKILCDEDIQQKLNFLAKALIIRNN